MLLYSSFKLSGKYFSYLIHSANGKGHGVHSPFVFSFIKFVLNGKSASAINEKIEAQRRKLLSDKTVLEVEDFGAGSGLLMKKKSRPVNKIAASSLKPKKYSRLLQRIIAFYDCKNVLELGTSFGITTAYIAAASNNPDVITMEGASSIAAVAADNFKALDLDNITIIKGNFDKTLPEIINNKPDLDLVFIDGNHRLDPTVHYFKTLLPSLKETSIVVFDDIHWSDEMEQAWETIKNHEAVTLSIDLFFIGLVFFRKDFKVKQHFTIRF